MKKNPIIFASFILVAVILSYAFYLNGNSDDKKESAQEIKWGNFENGIKETKSANKKMIVDVYTDWCGWCKKMDKATYSYSDVVSYINKNFVAVRLNAESKDKMNYLGETYTEQQLAQGFGITGYPSTIFFDENQKPITVIPGYIEGKDFMNILKYINEDIYKNKSYEEYIKSASK